MKTTTQPRTRKPRRKPITLDGTTDAADLRKLADELLSFEGTIGRYDFSGYLPGGITGDDAAEQIAEHADNLHLIADLIDGQTVTVSRR